MKLLLNDLEWKRQRNREKSQRFREKNPEKVRELNRQQYLKNKDAVAHRQRELNSGPEYRRQRLEKNRQCREKYQRQYQLDNKEHIQKQRKEYRERNNERIKAKKAEYNARPEVKKRKSERAAAEYRAKRDEFKSRTRARRKERNEYMKSIALKYGCQNSECQWNGKFLPNQLDFHHLNPAEKVVELAKMGGSSYKTIVEEMNKCVVLCKNCHAAVHAGEATVAESMKCVVDYERVKHLDPKVPAPQDRKPPKMFTHEGKTQTMREWSNETGIEFGTLKQRLYSGWTVSEAVSTPTGKQGRKT